MNGKHAYRGRFAPSPTGALHFGSLVAALGSFLEARCRAGSWLLRMEDLDRPRVVPGAANEILKQLEACGLTWDGEILWQSTRRDAYHAALDQLRREDLVYPCACSRREIADSAVAGIEGPVYPGTCRGGVADGRTPRAMRVLCAGEPIGFDDALQGRIEQRLDVQIGDFVLHRADDVFAYQLAVVVDDAFQGITHVVRGADLLASTPRQIHLQRLLGLPTPAYTHLPVALNSRREKLSKQTLAAPVATHDPVPQLSAALRFLGQAPPPELAHAGLVEFWEWAIAHWRLETVPKRAGVVADQTGIGSPL